MNLTWKHFAPIIGSGYLPAADYWRLGAIFGIIFFVIFTALSVPWVLMRG